MNFSTSATTAPSSSAVRSCSPSTTRYVRLELPAARSGDQRQQHLGPPPSPFPITHLKQWAAVSTQLGAMRVPPHVWLQPPLRLYCSEIWEGTGAAWGQVAGRPVPTPPAPGRVPGVGATAPAPYLPRPAVGNGILTAHHAGAQLGRHGRLPASVGCATPGTGTLVTTGGGDISGHGWDMLFPPAPAPHPP